MSLSDRVPIADSSEDCLLPRLASPSTVALRLKGTSGLSPEGRGRVVSVSPSYCNEKYKTRSAHHTHCSLSLLCTLLPPHPPAPPPTHIASRGQVLGIKPWHGLCSIHNFIIIVHCFICEVALGVEGNIINRPLGLAGRAELLECLLIEVTGSPLPESGLLCVVKGGLRESA